MPRPSFRFLLPLVAAILTFAACDTGGSLIGPRGKSALTVRLTDAPGDLAEAWVRVRKVQLVGGDSASTDSLAAPSELTPTDTGWIDLLALTGGKTSDLLSGSVEPGRYSQVRLVVCDMYIKTTDGQYIATPGASLPSGITAAAGSELKLTSQCQSGFKVLLRGDSLRLGADSAGTLVIDFDARRSFAHEAGKSGKWIVTPVLVATFTKQGGDSGSGAGSIAGAVTLASSITGPIACGAKSLTRDSLLKAFVPSAARGDTVRTGTTTLTGAYTISNLSPGTYAMSAERISFSNGDTLTYSAVPTPASVAVTAGAAAKADYAVSAAACKAH